MSVENDASFSRFIKVEKAKEFEAYRRIPKFNHIPLALINPSPRKKRSPTQERSPDLQLDVTKMRIIPKRYEPKVIPESLIRAPMESFGGSSPNSKKSGGARPKSAAAGSFKGKDKKGGAKDNKKMEGESKRVKRAELNKKVLFQEIKRLLDKAEETSTAPGGSAEVLLIPGY